MIQHPDFSGCFFINRDCLLWDQLAAIGINIAKIGEIAVALMGVLRALGMFDRAPIGLCQ